MKRLKIGNISATKERPLIAMSIIAETWSTVVIAAQKMSHLPIDVVEWRIDYLLDLSVLTVDNIRTICQIVGKPLIFTWRTLAEGGQIPYNQVKYTDVYQTAIQAGVAAVDIEVALLTDQQALLEMIPRQITVIGSKHHFMMTPVDLAEQLAAMVRLPIDVVKYAVMAQTSLDTQSLLATTKVIATHSELPLITMAMGQYGIPSRIIGYQFGSQLTFVSGSKSSAPGQITLTALLHKWGE